MAANSRPEPIEGEAAHMLTDHLRDVALVAQEMAKSERIALLRNESGAAVVDALLTNDTDRCIAHALNLCEV